MSTPSSEDSDASHSEEKKKVKPINVDKKSHKHKNDKGRHNEVPIKQENTMSVSELKRKREDETLKKAEKKNRSKKQNESSLRSGPFSDEEQKTILFAIFKGKDDTKATDDFFVQFSKSTRTRAAVKSKITKMREDLAVQINATTDFDLEKNGLIFLSSLFHFIHSCIIFFLICAGKTAANFLRPALIHKLDGEILLVQQKKSWLEITAGSNETHVRFGLKKHPLPQADGEAVETVQFAHVQFEIPLDHHIVCPFETDELKGFKLKVLPMRKNDFDGFQMF